MGYIYKITNQISKKCYIGVTKKNNPYIRWNEHKRKIEQGIGCPALQCAVKKYGIDNFTFEILIICFDEERYKFEIEYIKKYNSIAPNGYNLTKGGEGGGFYGKKHSQKTINKISQVSKQKYIDNPQLKKEMTERQKIVMNSQEVRNKHREIMAKASGIKIEQYEDNILLNTFNSLREASRITGIPRSTIMYNFNKNKVTDGITWKKIE